jgi:hypothetical protein
MEIEDETAEQLVKQNIKAHLLNIFDIYTNILIPNHKTYTKIKTEGIDDYTVPESVTYLFSSVIRIIIDKLNYRKPPLIGGVNLSRKRSETSTYQQKSKRGRMEEVSQRAVKRTRDSITTDEERYRNATKIDYYNIFCSNLNLHLQDDYTRYSNAIIYINNQIDIIYVELFYDLLLEWFNYLQFNYLQYPDKKQSGGKRRKYKHKGGNITIPLCGEKGVLTLEIYKKTGPLRIKQGNGKYDMNNDWIATQKELMTPFLYHLNDSEKEKIIIDLGGILQQDLYKDINSDRGGINGEKFKCGKHLQPYTLPELHPILVEEETKLSGFQFLEPSTDVEPSLQNFCIRDTVVAGLGDQIELWQKKSKLFPIPAISGLLDSAGHAESNSEYNIAKNRVAFDNQLIYIINPGIKCYKNYYPSLDRFTIEIALHATNGLQFIIYDTEVATIHTPFTIQFGDSGYSTIGAIKTSLTKNTKDDFFTYLESQGCNQEEIVSVYYLIKGMGDFNQILNAAHANNNFEIRVDLQAEQRSCNPEYETVDETVLMSTDMGVLKICHHLQIDFFIGTGNKSCTRGNKIYWRKLGSYIGKFFPEVLKKHFGFCVQHENEGDITSKDLNDLVIAATGAGAAAAGGGKRKTGKRATARGGVNTISSGLVYVISEGKTHVYLYFLDSSKIDDEILPKFYIITIERDIIDEQITATTNKEYQDLIKDIFRNTQIELDNARYLAFYDKICIHSKQLTLDMKTFSDSRTIFIKLIQKEIRKDNLKKSSAYILDRYSQLLKEPSNKLLFHKNNIDKWRELLKVQIKKRRIAIEGHIEYLTKIDIDLHKNTIKSCKASLKRLKTLERKINEYDEKQGNHTVNVLGTTQAFTTKPLVEEPLVEEPLVEEPLVEEPNYVNDIIQEVNRRFNFFFKKLQTTETNLKDEIIKNMKDAYMKKIFSYDEQIQKLKTKLEKKKKNYSQNEDYKTLIKKKRSEERKYKNIEKTENDGTKTKLDITDKEFEEQVMNGHPN